jgi:hypothetical protein
MNKMYFVLSLFLMGCSSLPQSRTAPVAQTPPKGSSGSLGKNIDELDSVMNKSLSRIDKLIAELGGK